MLLPLLGAIGLAIDFGAIMTARTKAQMAADAASLHAVGVARDQIRNSAGGDLITSLALADAKARATKLFKINAQQDANVTSTVDITVARTGQTITARTSFSVTTATIISKVFGRNAFSAIGDTSASGSLPTYSDVYLALDASHSMGIAATQAGMNVLYNATTDIKNGSGVVTKWNQPIKCVFGCHDTNMGGGQYWAESFIQVAKRYGVDLRIDILRNATLEMIEAAKGSADNLPIYRLGLYKMDASASKLTELAALTDNFDELSARAAGIGLAGGSSHTGNSFISESLATFAATVPASKDGSSQSSTKKYAFIVTDGLRNIYPLNNPTCTTGAGRCVSGVANRNADERNPSCEAMKANNVTVGVLYTTYVPIRPIDPSQKDWYQIEVVDNIKDMDRIARDLRGCASPGWYFQASDDKGVSAAMKAMFDQTTLAPSLTD